MKVFAVIAILAFVRCASAAPSVQDNRVEEQSSTFSRAAKYLGSCFESDDMTTCLAVKGITALNRAARSNNIDLLSGVTFKRDASAVQRSGKALTENDIISQLPQSAEERNGRLIDMAMQSVADFFGSHNLEVKIPTEATQEVARAIDEGRGKLKKLLGPLALAIGAKLFAIVPLLLGGLALLTTKAIIVAKIALLLALVVGGSRIFGSGGLGSKLGGGLGGLGGGLGGLGGGLGSLGGYSSNNGWTSGSNGGWSSGASSSYPYARSMDGDAQELAYAAQAPEQ